MALVSAVELPKPDHSGDPDLALWFTPQAIRDAKADAAQDDDVGQWIAQASDEQLVEVAQLCLQDDTLYSAFHSTIYWAAHEVMKESHEQPH